VVEREVTLRVPLHTAAHISPSFRMSSQYSLRVLVVDDEAPARRKIIRLLREESAVEIAGEADSE